MQLSTLKYILEYIPHLPRERDGAMQWWEEKLFRTREDILLHEYDIKRFEMHNS